MRTGFLCDERTMPLGASVALSRRESRAGATVPLEVPVRCICRECGGRGESWAERCGRCDGTGAEFLRHQVQVNVPAGVFDGARFHFTVAPRHHPATLIELRISVA
jgi:ribosomal protein L40E